MAARVASSILCDAFVIHTMRIPPDFGKAASVCLNHNVKNNFRPNLRTDLFTTSPNFMRGISDVATPDGFSMLRSLRKLRISLALGERMSEMNSGSCLTISSTSLVNSTSSISLSFSPLLKRAKSAITFSSYRVARLHLMQAGNSYSCGHCRSLKNTRPGTWSISSDGINPPQKQHNGYFFKKFCL